MNFQMIRKNIEEKSPLIHNITNYVTVNDCANIQLGFGGNPIMADAIEEVEEVTPYCNSLIINIGTLNSRTIESMFRSIEIANSKNIPVILDPVGYGFTSLRTNTVDRMLEEYEFSVIKGNISEIKGILNKSKTTRGVDVSAEDAAMTEDNISAIAKELSNIYNCVVIITSKVDVIAYKDKVSYIYNGDKMMADITGTGCMITAMLGVAVGANTTDIFTASTYTVGMMSLCGELAVKDLNERKLSTLKMIILDNISSIPLDKFMKEVKYEVK